MKKDSKFHLEALTFDDVLLVPSYSEVIPSETNVETKLTKNIDLNIPDPVKHIQEFASRMPEAKPSVLLDVEAGRASEVDMINGAIPREAYKISLTAPINDTLNQLVLSLEQSKFRKH